MDRGDLQREVDQRLQKNGRKRGRGDPVRPGRISSRDK